MISAAWLKLYIHEDTVAKDKLKLVLHVMTKDLQLLSTTQAGLSSNFESKIKYQVFMYFLKSSAKCSQLVYEVHQLCMRRRVKKENYTSHTSVFTLLQSWSSNNNFFLYVGNCWQCGPFIFSSNRWVCLLWLLFSAAGLGPQMSITNTFHLWVCRLLLLFCAAVDGPTQIATTFSPSAYFGSCFAQPIMEPRR